MKSKKFLVGIAGIVTVIAVVLGTLTHLRKSSNTQTESYRTFKAITSKDIEVFGENKQFVAMTKGWGVGKRYTISQEGRILDKKKGEEVPRHPRQKHEFWNVVIFDLDQKEYPSKKIDLYNVVKAYNSSYFPVSSDYVFHFQDKDVLVLTIRSKGEIESNKDKQIFLDLQTHQVSDLPEDYHEINPYDEWGEGNSYRYYSPIQGTTLSKTAKEKGYLAIDVLKGNPKKLNLSTNLIHDEPEVKAILNEGGGVYRRPTMVTIEEWFNQLLYWLAPVGEQGLTVYPVKDQLNENSQPLTDFPLKSYQDYLNWKESNKKE